MSRPGRRETIPTWLNAGRRTAGRQTVRTSRQPSGRTRPVGHHRRLREGQTARRTIARTSRGPHRARRAIRGLERVDLTRRAPVGRAAKEHQAAREHQAGQADLAAEHRVARATKERRVAGRTAKVDRTGLVGQVGQAVEHRVGRAARGHRAGQADLQADLPAEHRVARTTKRHPAAGRGARRRRARRVQARRVQARRVRGKADPAIRERAPMELARAVPRDRQDRGRQDRAAGVTRTDRVAPTDPDVKVQTGPGVRRAGRRRAGHQVHRGRAAPVRQAPVRARQAPPERQALLEQAPPVRPGAGRVIHRPRCCRCARTTATRRNRRC